MRIGKAAAHFGISLDAIRRLIDRGEIASVQVSEGARHAHVRLSEVARVLGDGPSSKSPRRVPISEVARTLGVGLEATSTLLADESIAWRPGEDGTPTIARASAEVLTREIASSEVASRLGVSQVVVRVWARKGWLVPVAGSGVKPGQPYRFHDWRVRAFARELADRQAAGGIRAAKERWDLDQAAAALKCTPDDAARLVERGHLVRFGNGFRPGDVRRAAPMVGREDLIDALRAADLLGIDRSSLKTYVRAGQLQVVLRDGPRQLFKEEDVRRLAALHQETVTGPAAARILGVLRGTVQKWQAAGRLPAVSGPDIDNVGVYRYSRQLVERVASERSRPAKKRKRRRGLASSTGALTTSCEFRSASALGLGP